MLAWVMNMGFAASDSNAPVVTQSNSVTLPYLLTCLAFLF